MPLKIGLTGGIGSGKSTVARLFALLDVPVYDADSASKRLYQTNEKLKADLQQHFGTDIYVVGQLDRARLSSLVFSDAQKLALLNSLVHPLTIQDAKDWISQQSGPYIIKEAALLFESGAVADLDYVVGVFAPQHLRLSRVMKRDGVTREEVLKRMNRQISETIKMRLCDFVLTNDEQKMLIPQVIALHKGLLLLAEKNKASSGA